MTQRADSPNTVPATTYRYNDNLDKLYVSAPVDRIRWASVLGGLFAVLSTITVLTVLGIAVGLSTFDANNPETFGIGAGVYGAVAFIVAFGLGGFLAARTAAVAGSGNGLLNGAMVWLVALPLIVNVLGTGLDTVLGIAGSAVTTVANTAATVAGSAIEVAAPIVAENVDEIAAAAQTVAPTIAAGATQVNNALAEGTAEATVEAPVEAVVNQAQEAVATVQSQIEDIDPEDINEATRDASGAAWAALLALGLSAAAAAGGGYLGARSRPTDVAILDR